MSLFEDTTTIKALRRKRRTFLESTPYGIQYIKALEVSDSQVSNQKLCILDSGYDLTHEDLPKEEEGEKDSKISGESLISDTLYCDSPQGQCPWDKDTNGHGTHVAGIIAALGGNEKGVVGVVRNGQMKLHIVRAFGSALQTSLSTIIAGINSCIAAETNIINLSLGVGKHSTSFEIIIESAIDKGILIVASAGNTGTNAYQYPASYPNVMSVSSIDQDYEPSSFSTYNDRVDIAAPGTNVLSTVPGDGYDRITGTSMSCPHVAAAAALIWSHFPTYSAGTVQKIIKESAQPLEGATGHSIMFGSGVIDTKAAFDLAPRFNQTGPSTPIPTTVAPTLSLSPSSSPTEYCPTGEMYIKVVIFTDRFPHETSWQIINDDRQIVQMRDKYNRTLHLYEDKFCISTTESKDYTFAISDSHGDGICCSYGTGYYMVFVDGTRIDQGGDNFTEGWDGFLFHGSFLSKPSLMPSTKHSSNPSQSLSAPTTTLMPARTKNLTCADDAVEVGIAIFTDRFPSEISWRLTNNKNQVVHSRDNYNKTLHLYEDTFCISSTAEGCGLDDYTFTIFDSFGDGICCSDGTGYYMVSVNGTRIDEGNGNFTNEFKRFSLSASEQSCASPVTCEENINIQIEVFTDRYPDETFWKITNDKNQTIESSEDFQLSFELYRTKVCLPDVEGEYTFTILDSHLDGLCCSHGEGYYKVYVEGIRRDKHGDEFTGGVESFQLAS